MTKKVEVKKDGRTYFVHPNTRTGLLRNFLDSITLSNAATLEPDPKTATDMRQAGEVLLEAATGTQASKNKSSTNT